MSEDRSHGGVPPLPSSRSPSPDITTTSAKGKDVELSTQQLLLAVLQKFDDLEVKSAHATQEIAAAHDRSLEAITKLTERVNAAEFVATKALNATRTPVEPVKGHSDAPSASTSSQHHTAVPSDTAIPQNDDLEPSRTRHAVQTPSIVSLSPPIQETPIADVVAPSSDSTQAFKLRATDIPKFSGASGTISVDEWVIQITAIITRSNVRDSEITARLATILHGAASKWYFGLAHDECPSTWAEWAPMFLKAFRKGNYEADLRNRARARVLQEGEDVSFYFYDKRHLLRTAFKSASNSDHAFEILQGLPSQFRWTCNFKTDSSLEDLHREIKDREGLLKTCGWSDDDPNRPPKKRFSFPPRVATQNVSQASVNPSSITQPAGSAPNAPQNVMSSVPPMQRTNQSSQSNTAPASWPEKPPGLPKGLDRPCRHCNQWHFDMQHVFADSRTPWAQRAPQSAVPATNTNTTPLGPRQTASVSEVNVNVGAGNAQATSEVFPADATNVRTSINAPSANQSFSATPCYVAAEVNGNQHRAIVDGGASVSLVNREYAAKHFSDFPTQTCPAFSISGIGGDFIFGFKSIPVKFKGSTAAFTVVIDFYVSSSSVQGLLLGNDALLRLGTQTDTVASTVTFRGVSLPASFVARTSRSPVSDDHGRLVRMKETFNVRAGHRARVQMTVDGDVKGTFLVTPTVLNGQPSLPCRAAYVVAESATFYGEVVNLGDKPVRLRAGDVVGRTSELDTNADDTLVNGDINHPSDDDQTLAPFPDDTLDVNTSLTPEQRARVNTMLQRHRTTFSDGSTIGRARHATFDIDTGDAKPVSQPPYHASPRQRAAIDNAVDNLIITDAVEPSKSAWSSPVIVVYQHGKPRMCIDYRKLNSVTKADQYPLMRIDDILSQFQGKCWFSTLDANRGYHQVPVSDSAAEKLAFRTHKGLLQPKVMPFGPKGAPATFQRMMDVILAASKWRFALAYLDDVIIYSDTFDDHIDHVDAVLSQIGNGGLTISIPKSHLFFQSLDALGHNVSNLGIGMLDRNVKAILDQDPPTSLKGLERFLGMAGHYRRFIPHFATISLPIVEAITLSRKNRTFVFDADARSAWDVIKSLVTTRPILAHPNYHKPFIVDVDASLVGFGAVLSQKDDQDTIRPIAFVSRATSRSERNYAATELECTAMTWALCKFTPYIDGSDVTLVTDHAALQWLLAYKGSNQRILRQCMLLQPMRDLITIVHRPGKLHRHVDQLSRAPVRLNDDISDSDDENGPCLTNVNWKDAEDPIFMKTIRDNLFLDPKYVQIIEECKISRDDIIKNAKHHRRLPFLLVDGLLYFYRPSFNKYTLCVPDVDSVRTDIIHDHHDSPLAAHRSADKTYLSIAQHYHWSGLRHDVDRYVRTCDPCQRNKPTIKPTAPMQPIEPVPERWHTITMDFAVHLPKSRGYDAILVIIDKFSKRTHLVPTHVTATAADTARLLIWNVIRLHGFPRNIISDRDSKFTSSLWKSVTSAFGTKLRMSTSFWPPTDGQSERQVRTLKEALRHYINIKQDNWYDALPALELSYNSSVHSSTGRTPFELDLGIPLRILAAPLTPSDDLDSLDGLAFIDKLNADAMDAIECIQRAQGYQSTQHDKNARPIVYKIGDEVLLRAETFHPAFVKVTKSKKLGPTYYGPFKVLATFGLSVIELDLPEHVKMSRRVNTFYTRPYHHRSAPLPTATKKIEQVLGFRLGRATNEYPKGKPQWFVRYAGAPTGAEQWLDRYLVEFYGGLSIIEPIVNDDTTVDPVVPVDAPTSSSRSSGSVLALNPSIPVADVVESTVVAAVSVVSCH